MRRTLSLLFAAVLATTGLVVTGTASPAFAATMPDGTYLILNDLSGRCLNQDHSGGVARPAILAWQCVSGARNQEWRKVGGSVYYQFINRATGKCLNQDYSGGVPHSRMLAYTCGVGSFINDKWITWWDTGRGAYVLANAQSGHCLDQDYSGGVPHSTVLAYTCKPNSQLNGVTNQHWFFIRIA